MAFSQLVKKGSTGAALQTGTKTVTIIATKLTLLSNPCYGVIVEADSANATNVYFGGSNVTTNNGITLFPAQKMFIPIDNMNAVYFVCSALTEKVRYSAVVDEE